MNLTSLDPRTKLLFLLGVSSAALFLRSLAAFMALFILAAFILLVGGVRPGLLWARLRGLLGLIALLFLIQCLSIRSGQPLLKLAGLTLVTEAGLSTAILVSLRLLIIALGVLIVLSGGARDYLPALTQLKFSYKTVFMTLAALRFLPMLREEARDVLCAAQMRGLRLKKTGLKNLAKAYISIMLPAVAGAMQRVKRLSIAMEARAFRAYPSRTVIRSLHLRKADWAYAVLFCAVLATILLIFA